MKGVVGGAEMALAVDAVIEMSGMSAAVISPMIEYRIFIFFLPQGLVLRAIRADRRGPSCLDV